MSYKNQKQVALEGIEIELEQYSSIFGEETVTEFRIYNNSVGVPKVGLFEEVNNYFLVY